MGKWTHAFEDLIVHQLEKSIKYYDVKIVLAILYQSFWHVCLFTQVITWFPPGKLNDEF